MNKLKNTKKGMLILSVLLLFLVIGAANAADDEISNESISTSTDDVDTLSPVDSVDDSISTAENSNNDIGSLNNNIDSNQQLLGSNSENNVLTTGNSTELQKLIDESTDVLNLDKDYTVNSPIYFNKTVSVNGNGHVITLNPQISGQHLFYIWNCVNCEIKNMTIVSSIKSTTSFRSPDIVVYNASYCNIIDCNFDDVKLNLVDYSHDVLVDRCNFINSTSGGGGAIFTRGHGPATQKDYCGFGPNPSVGTYYPCYNLTISNSNFKNIYGVSRAGAIEYNAPNGTIINCTIENCYTASGGAGIDLYRTASYTKVINVTFINNTATGNGGGLWVEHSDSNHIDILNCTFINNTARQGGGIYFNAAYSNIINCTFEGNKAVEGGAVKFNAPNSYMGFSIYINNTATVDGGALCSAATGSIVESCSFINNTAPTGKDFYAHDGKTITFIGLKFASLWLTNNNTEYSVTDGYGTWYDRPAAWRDDYDFLESFLDTSQGKATIYLVGDITSLPEKILNIPNIEIIGYDPIMNPTGATIDMAGWDHRVFTVESDNVQLSNLLF